jgi:hypothetical protein
MLHTSCPNQAQALLSCCSAWVFLKLLLWRTCLHTCTQVFDDRFQDPRHTSEDRFLWDYFHIPNQYTMHRTQVRRQQLLLLHALPHSSSTALAAQVEIAHTQTAGPSAFLTCVDTCILLQAGAYFSFALNEQLVDALLDYGEKNLVSVAPGQCYSSSNSVHVADVGGGQKQTRRPGCQRVNVAELMLARPWLSTVCALCCLPACLSAGLSSHQPCLDVVLHRCELWMCHGCN